MTTADLTIRDSSSASVDGWSHLRDYGYSPGPYMNNCLTCAAPFIGDKRAVTCLSCAEKHYARLNGDRQSES